MRVLSFAAMPLLFGLICLALAISLAVIWWSAAFVAALQVLLVMLLFVAGVVLTLVGYSALKAHNTVRDAIVREKARPAKTQAETENTSAQSDNAAEREDEIASA